MSAGPAAWYAPSDDVESFAKTALALIDEPEARQIMGRIGRARIVEHLGWPAQAPAYAGVYRALVGDARTGRTEPAPVADHQDDVASVIDLRGPARRPVAPSSAR